MELEAPGVGFQLHFTGTYNLPTLRNRDQWAWDMRTVFFYVFIILLVTSFILPVIIDLAREHGGDGLSAIFTPGRLSTENVLRVLSPALALEGSLSFSMFFFVLGRLGKSSRRSIYNPILVAFFIALVGFGASLYYTFMSNMTGTATPLLALYAMIGILILAIAFMMLTMDGIASVLS